MPRLLVEVKSAVPVFALLEGQHLGQVLVQAYYTMIDKVMDKVSVCVCDQKQFHFLGIKLILKDNLSPISPLVEVKWVESVTGFSNIVDLTAKSLHWPEEEDN